MSEPPAEPSLQEVRCSFCRAARVDVGALIAGPDVFICDACVKAGIQILIEETAEDVAGDAACSFCRKARSEIKVLIPGEAAIICDECVQLCGEIVGQAVGPVGAPRLPVARVRQPSWWRRFVRRG